MPTPTVTAEHFDQALADCLTNPNLRKPGKPRWNQQRTDEMTKDLGELTAMITASVEKHPDSVTSGAFAINLAAVLHRAYTLAGAKFTPISHQDMALLLRTEQDYLEHLHNLPVAMAQDEESASIANRPNGEVLKIAIEMLHDFAMQHPITNKERWPEFIQYARINIGVAHAALNAASAQSA